MIWNIICVAFVAFFAFLLGAYSFRYNQVRHRRNLERNLRHWVVGFALLVVLWALLAVIL